MQEERLENVAMRREGGRVERWHIVPHHGHDTVASHSWNCAQLLIEFNPGASRALIIYMLEHDVTERWIGDIPASSKSMFPTISLGVKQAESLLENEMNLMGTAGLTKHERCWVRAVDALEAWLWCQDQLAMGNRNAEQPDEKLREWLLSDGNVPGAIMAFVEQYEWKRYPDYLWEGKHYGKDHE